MSFENCIKKFYNSSGFGKFIFFPFMGPYKLYLRVLPDDVFAKRRFKKRFGYKLDLSNPKTLNEKIQWLKLYDRTPLHTICADKLAVRDYVKKIVGEEYLIHLILHTNKPDEITPEKLPDYPIIIKANHSSSCYNIVREKNNANWKSIRRECKRWLKENTYYMRKEWQYKDISPCIVIEKLLMNDDGSIPFDYKIHCFHGVPKMIQVDVGRGSGKHYRNWYNTDWTRAPFKWSSVFHGQVTDPSDEEVDRPQRLDDMLDLSSKLSKNFKYSRIDWYCLKDKIYFGEITFHHDGGFRPIYPEEWDLKLGNYLTLQ